MFHHRWDKYLVLGQPRLYSKLTIVFLSVQLMPFVEWPLILRKDNKWYGGLNALAYWTASGLIPSRSLPMLTHLKYNNAVLVKLRSSSSNYNSAPSLMVLLYRIIYLPMIIIWRKALNYNFTISVSICHTGNWPRSLHAIPTAFCILFRCIHSWCSAQALLIFVAIRRFCHWSCCIGCTTRQPL